MTDNYRGVSGFIWGVCISPRAGEMHAFYLGGCWVGTRRGDRWFGFRMRINFFWSIVS